MPVFIHLLAEMAVQSKCSPTNKCINKMWHMYRGIIVLKRKNILPYETAWISLEVIMLNERSQTERHKLCVEPFGLTP